MSTSKNGPKNIRKVYLHYTDENGIAQTDKRRVVATVATLKDGTRRITQNGANWYLRTDGTIGSEVSASVTLQKDDEGKWRVYFNMDRTFADILDILQDGDADLTGNLASGDICGVFADCAEGFTESDPLTDEKLAKVREYFTPEYLSETK